MKLLSLVKVKESHRIHPKVMDAVRGKIGIITDEDEMRDWVVTFPGDYFKAFDSDQLELIEE